MKTRSLGLELVMDLQPGTLNLEPLNSGKKNKAPPGELHRNSNARDKYQIKTNCRYSFGVHFLNVHYVNTFQLGSQVKI
jgi:hypothetical protein